MAKITLGELEQLIRANRLSKADLQRYFRPAPEASPHPFFPGVSINPDEVEAPPPGPRAYGLGSGIARWIITNQRHDRDRWFADKRRTDPSAKIVVSDGDSWFLHPLLYDVIDRLAGACALKSLDWPGDELSSIASLKEYVAALRETGASILLVSAGGNDLVANGKLADHLNEYQGGMSASQLLRDSYDALIRTSMERYDDIFRTASAVASVNQIVCHGYDYAIPGVNGEAGKWLGTPMRSRRIENPAIQKEVSVIMADKFNTALQKLARKHPKVDCLDLRGTVDPGEWSDELHPKEGAFLKVAREFRIAMKI